jgi:coenzyme F420-0:L-glutamate ligase/coenzyme F420-1:gamma-L-glutamate ligase
MHRILPVHVSIIPVPMEKDVNTNDDLAELILSSIKNQKQKLYDNDILVIAQKIVSKAEGRLVSLNSVRPSKRAYSIAAKHGKDPRVVELILRESKQIVKIERGIIIVETKHGLVCANAGVDQSNINGSFASLLPLNPDGSAAKIRAKIKKLTRKEVAVIIADTFGRPFREGQVNVAIGVSGLRPITDYRGLKDIFGKKLKVTEIAVADEIASAAELVMGKLDLIPVVIIRGLRYKNKQGSAKDLIRKRKNDLFR